MQQVEVVLSLCEILKGQESLNMTTLQLLLENVLPYIEQLLSPAKNLSGWRESLQGPDGQQVRAAANIYHATEV